MNFPRQFNVDCFMLGVFILKEKNKNIAKQLLYIQLKPGNSNCQGKLTFRVIGVLNKKTGNT